MLLAAVPVASTFPADRLLTFTSLGAMGLIAQLLAATVRDRALLGDGKLRRFGVSALAGFFLLIHLVLAPPFLVLRARSMVAVGRVLDRAERSVPDAHTVIIATTPSDALAAYVPIMRRSRNQAGPAHLYWLATATTAVTLERLDARTLRVAPERGFLLHEIDQMMRSPRLRAFAVGDRVPLSGVTIEIESVTAEGRPLTVLAQFERPLEDSTLTWLRWDRRTYVPYAPPAIGTRETLPAVDFSQLLED
jgi:hypothetical protein